MIDAPLPPGARNEKSVPAGFRVFFVALAPGWVHLGVERTRDPGFQCGMSVPPPSARAIAVDSSVSTAARIQAVTIERETRMRESIGAPFLEGPARAQDL